MYFKENKFNVRIYIEVLNFDKDIDRKFIVKH